ncbi:hypothetical protein [Mycoplasma suis]|uniref:Uncharacterized protein n=1 Tax=Mycoplasma suis (strain Illinois) TaxID=768700 RepID=F0QQ25_MYCSL|nr:hypothetical protein [Mycoplasma suis]ADX97595.1 hypothetical protein MSU_0051 [Mycoplasma suis str. Illinois]
MAFLSSFSPKILSTLVLGVAGSGAITGAVIATRNKEVISSDESANPDLGDVRKSQEDNTPSEGLEKLKGQNFEEDQHLGKDLETNLSKEPLTSGRTDKENIQPQTPELNEEHNNPETNLEAQGKEEVKEEKEDLSLGNESEFQHKSVQENNNQPSPQELSSSSENEKELRKQKEEEIAKEDKEFRDKEVRLEAVWIYQSGSSKEKMCILLKKGDNKRIPELMELIDGDESEKGEFVGSEDCRDEETSWTENRDVYILGENNQALWVRGEETEFKSFIDSNWNDLLKGTGFVEREKEKPSTEEERMKKLESEGHFCKITHKELEQQKWIELTCLSK